MNSRFIRIGALAFLVGLAPLAADAQHASGKHEAPAAAPAAAAPHGADAKDAKAAPAAAAKGTPAASGPAAAAPTPAGGGNNLKAALERISQQIAESHDARESPSRSTAAAPRAAEPARIKLAWRPSVVWPAEVGGDAPTPRPSTDSDRVTLIWAEPFTSAIPDPLRTTTGITDLTGKNLTRCLGPLGCKASN